MAAADRKGEPHPAVLAHLAEVRGQSAFALANIRVVGSGAWLAIGLWFGPPAFGRQLPWVCGYLGIGLVLLTVLWRAPRLRHHYWYALVVLDCPLLLLTQRAAMPWSNPGTSLAFSALFLSLMLFWFGLLEPRSWLIAVCTAAIAGMQSLLLYDPAALRLDFLAFSLLGIALAPAAGRIFGQQTAFLASRAIQQQLRSDRLGRYFSETVRQQILEADELAPAEFEVTVLFADLSGFTTLSDGRPSTQIFLWIDEFLGAMVKAVFEAGGTVDKFLGDGILAYFGAPLPRADHPSAAVSCALAMQEGLKGLNVIRQARSDPPLKMGIGLHLGMVTMGSVGPPTRREFTLLGDAVNVASRVGGITKTLGVGILASEPVRNRAPEFDWLDFDEATIRGKTDKLGVFSPARPIGVRREAAANPPG